MSLSARMTSISSIELLIVVKVDAPTMVAVAEVAKAEAAIGPEQRMKNNGKSGDRPRDMKTLLAWRYIRILGRPSIAVSGTSSPFFPSPLEVR